MDVELGVEAFWLLMIAGMLSGAASLWALRRWSDPAKARASINRVVAHLFELRLFADEPAVVMRAQRDLLAANWQFLRQMVGPSLRMLLPIAVLLVGIDALCGRAPLEPGRPAIVTVEYAAAESVLPGAQLLAPEGIQVETAALRIPGESQICWRIRPIKRATGDLQIHCNGRVLRKTISSRTGLQWLSDNRAGSIAGFVLNPLELPFSGSPIRLISIRYPAATVFHLNWLIWFSAASIAGALGLTYLRY